MTGPTPDFIAAVAELNARVRQLARENRAAAGRAILMGDRTQLVRALQDALDLLDAVVRDLTETRAAGVAAYAGDPAFRDAFDDAAAEE